MVHRRCDGLAAVFFKVGVRVRVPVAHKKTEVVPLHE